MDEKRRQKRLEVARQIAIDAEQDAIKLDGRPFNGKEVAESMGEILAQVHALSNIVVSMLEEQENQK